MQINRVVINIEKLLFILLLFSFTLVLPCFAQEQTATIESAQEKYNNHDYDGALADLDIILQSDPDNLEAKKLQNQILKSQRIEKSQELTELALIEIDNKNFPQALELLTEALELDPNNKKARELYLAMFEISEIEGESSSEEELIAANQEGETGEQAGISSFPRDEGEQADQISSPQYEYFWIQITPKLIFTSTNNIDYLDTSITSFGTKLDIIFYFNFWAQRLGLSLDYSGNILKFGGIEEINFLIHRANISARFRTYFFEDQDKRFTVGARLNYHIYVLQNLEDQGAYDITFLYGPSLGIFISDPIISRFTDSTFFKNMGFEFETNGLIIPGLENNPWLFNLEIYGGIYYKIDVFCFTLGYRLYSIMKDDITESSHEIELGVRYYF